MRKRIKNAQGDHEDSQPNARNISSAGDTYINFESDHLLFFRKNQRGLIMVKTWHLAKVPTMQVRNVWLVTGQRVKIVNKELFEGDWGWVLSRYFNSTSHESHFLFFNFTLWDFFKGSIFADISQVEMTKVIVRWRLSINQTSSNEKDTCNLSRLLL